MTRSDDDKQDITELFGIVHRHDIDLLELKMRVTSAESAISDVNAAHVQSKEQNAEIVEELKDAIVGVRTDLAVFTTTINTGVSVLKASVYLFSGLIVTVLAAGWAIYKQFS